MYDASKIVARQMKSITGSLDTLPEILSSEQHVERVIEATLRHGFSDDSEVVREALNRLRISYTAYEKHRARNVYNSAYSNWWSVAGREWYAHLQTTIGVIGLGSVGGAALATFSKHFHSVGYDIDGRGDWNEVLLSNAVIVCVPTNATSDGKLDVSSMFQVAADLSKEG